MYTCVVNSSNLISVKSYHNYKDCEDLNLMIWQLFAEQTIIIFIHSSLCHVFLCPNHQMTSPRQCFGHSAKFDNSKVLPEIFEVRMPQCLFGCNPIIWIIDTELSNEVYVSTG